MRRILHIAYVLAVLSAASVCLASCSDLKDVPTEKAVANTVLMRIMPDQELPMSKSDGGLTEEESVINTLRIYAFTNGQKVGYHYQDAPIVRDFLMDIGMLGADPSTGKQTVKFYIIANEDAVVTEEDMHEFDESTSESQLNEYRFIALAQHKGLPMFCADTVMINTRVHADMDSLDPEKIDITGHEGHILLARKLSFQLKRPFGKLTVEAARMSSSTPDVHIKSVSMLAKGTRHYNYMMPQTTEVLESLSPRMNDRPLLDENQTFIVTQTLADGYQQLSESYCFEVPFGSESWNVPNSDNSVVIKTVFSVGEGEEIRTVYIYLPPVHRNEWIKVKCTVSGEGQIRVNYDVRDWDYEMTDVNGDGEEDYIVFDYPTHTYLLPSLPVSGNPSPDPDPDNGEKILPQMSTSEPFVCFFQMLYPSGQTWRPTIFAGDAPASDFEVKVFLNDTVTAAPADQNGGYGTNDGDTYFRIEVHPLNTQNVGSKIYLGITAEIQGFGHSEYLLINGSQSELFWPSEGGSDPNALIITQIE